MSTNRIQRFAAVGLVVTVGLLLVLAVQVGLTAAAGTSEVAASKAAQIRLRIHLEGGTRPLGPEGTGARGRFTLVGAIFTRSGPTLSRSGEIADRRTFRDSNFRVQNFGRIRLPNNYPYGRTLVGAKGRISIKVHEAAGLWTVTGGTGAYAGLRGRGTLGGRYRVTIDQTMTGTVWK